MSKILFWDIETSLSTVATFQLKTEYIPHTNILTDWYIICGAWKWLGEKEIHSIATNSQTNPPFDPISLRDDIEVCKKLRSVLLEADVIVHHNGDAFDVKKLNSRLIKHGLQPLPKLTTIDTLKLARKFFYFMSNRLDALGRHFNLGRKEHVYSELWMDILTSKTFQEESKSTVNKMLIY